MRLYRQKNLALSCERPWFDPRPQIKFFHFCNFSRFSANKLEIEVFCRGIEPLKRVGINKTEYVLLKAIIYCYFAINSKSTNARSTLQKEQEKYTLTLLRYLQNQYGDSAGSTKFAEILSLVETFACLANKHKQMHVLGQMESEIQNHGKIKRMPDFLDRIMLN